MGLKSGFKKLSWSDDEKTIRGSFIQLVLTFLYTTAMAVSMIWHDVAGNLKEVAGFAIPFYAVSFTVWAGKKSIEGIMGLKDALPSQYKDMISQILDKVSPPGTTDKDKIAAKDTMIAANKDKTAAKDNNTT
jgi:hypothetical protein